MNMFNGKAMNVFKQWTNEHDPFLSKHEHSARQCVAQRQKRVVDEHRADVGPEGWYERISPIHPRRLGFLQTNNTVSATGNTSFLTRAACIP